MFKIGDKVTPVEAFGFGFKMGDIHTVESVSGPYVNLENHGVWRAWRFKLVEENEMEKKTPHKHAEGTAHVPHKHCNVIKAWADGATIQFSDGEVWMDVGDNHPSWFEEFKYRVKPPEPVRTSVWQGIGREDIGMVYEIREKVNKNFPYIIERRFEDGLLVDVVVHKV